ncbi:hypothetical protein PVAP13_6KG402801 [Panicum virgatum]|uniref:Uncharacterized protein n=1 Tax=Panicum virgatum TaxID=38727 RepID=A0A8T0RLJ7_PANVG|nr:hypothetical protein PVAP13_6KG402801 [Panicum virgatum]
MVRQCDRAIFEAEIEDERKMNNPPTFHGFAYSGETSDDDDPNDAYYYAGTPSSTTTSHQRPSHMKQVEKKINVILKTPTGQPTFCFSVSTYACLYNHERVCIYITASELASQ